MPCRDGCQGACHPSRASPACLSQARPCPSARLAHVEIHVFRGWLKSRTSRVRIFSWSRRPVSRMSRSCRASPACLAPPMRASSAKLARRLPCRARLPCDAAVFRRLSPPRAAASLACDAGPCPRQGRPSRAIPCACNTTIVARRRAPAWWWAEGTGSKGRGRARVLVGAEGGGQAKGRGTRMVVGADFLDGEGADVSHEPARL